MTNVKLKQIIIIKPVVGDPFKLGYSVGETADVTPEMYDLLIEAGHGKAVKAEK